MKDTRWLWQRERAPSCEGLVGLLGVLACAVCVIVGLELFKYFFAVALAAGLGVAAISYLAHR